MATTSIVRAPGDYQIVTSNGGVVIDTGNSGVLRTATSGTVRIYGSLDVVGSTTQIQTTNTNIIDNIIFLNSNETNPYVTLGTAGIAISRGSSTSTDYAATLIYDDNAYWTYDNITSNRGVWSLSVALVPTALRVNAIRIGPGASFLNFLGKENPTGMLNVQGTTNYESRVLDDDDIPNKKYVDDRFFVGNELARKLQVGKTQITINDNSVSPSDAYYNPTNSITATLGTSTNIVLKLSGQAAEFKEITIDGTQISVNPDGQSQNIILTPYNTGTVEIASGISMRYTPQPNSVLSNHIEIYTTSTIGGGGTGIYYSTNSRHDELVSRKRAIIYGIIF